MTASEGTARFQAVEQVRSMLPRSATRYYAEDAVHGRVQYVVAERAWLADRVDEAYAALSLLEQLAEATEDAVGNTLVLLPVTGSDNAGYRPSGSTQTTLMATLEEWNDAAQSICNLHALLAAVRSGRAGA